MLSFTRGHTTLQVSYCFCLALLRARRSGLQFLDPSMNVLISPSFLEGIFYVFLDVADPGWWLASYRQHRVDIIQREPEIQRVCTGQLSQPGETWARGSTGGWRRGPKKLLAASDAVSPSPPCWLQYATEAKSDQHGACSDAIFSVNWSGKNSISELQKKPFAHWLSDTTDAQASLPPTAISASLHSLSLSWSIFYNPDLI